MLLRVAGYELDAGLAYEPDTNLWVTELGGGRVRIGYDPLGAETTGDVVAVSFAQAGARLARGDALAIVEAAKFVGPLPVPVGGVLAAVNDTVIDSPGAVNADPLGAWLAELDDADPHDLARLIRGEDAITGWFEGAVERFRREGAIAE